ncbi:succinylglutamate-semialdehyde dehydrogenase [Sphingomonas sp.]|uniref:succinylglutamate-semialdehyde dehydrogenase n=1 Tax=Sphingomonas sp. TaxID=28214 RepID=UPI003CC5BBEB
MTGLLIDGRSREGGGERFASADPAYGETVWAGSAASAGDVADAVAAARRAASGWARTPLAERRAVVTRFAACLAADRSAFACLLARETGKPLWEADAEVGAMIGKAAVSIAAQTERAGERHTPLPFGESVLRHRPHGVMAVLGPYNFPGHLPNGHIIPALLAGNTAVFKPSELCPAVGERMAAAWIDAGLPPGVLNLVQGGRETGAALADADIDGLLFTGSAAAGAALRRATSDRPHVIVALELGGNNPLVAWDGEPDAVAALIVQSAFATAGQRCSCARRLIVPNDARGEAIIAATLALADRLLIGAWDAQPEPFMGPLINAAAAARADAQVTALIERGARVLRPFANIIGLSDAFRTPALLDVTGCEMPDEEIFAPVLQVTRVDGFDAAIAAANATRYGLAAGLISDDADRWARFASDVRAGVVNRNRPTVGAAAGLPFGGPGASGNHRPSAYYAADYCAWPMASFEAAAVADTRADMRGLRA